MTHPWPQLKWWESGERQAAEEKYDDERQRAEVYPAKSLLYRALSTVKEEDVKVCIIGQDPYPGGHGTGVAFSVARGLPKRDWPPTLKLFLGEYSSDLGYDVPDHGELLQWSRSGVLLWNAIPAVRSGSPLSLDWVEWDSLTREIVEKLSERGVVFVLLGAVARRYEKDVKPVTNRVVVTSHPSPRGNRNSKTPFTGSRLFSTVNAKLVELGKSPIDWELKDEPPRKSDVQPPVVGRGDVLPNITGAKLGGLKKQGVSPNIYTSLVF